MLWDDPYYDCDTEFRFYWAHRKLNEEFPDLARRAQPGNPYPFLHLVKSPCDRDSMTQMLAQPLDSFIKAPMDGVLFYHKKLHYIPGTTPLVG